MIPLSRNSLKLYHPVIEVACLKKSIPGTRYASLTSAIGRAARKSAAAEASRENRDTRRLLDNRRSPASSLRTDSSITFSDRHAETKGPGDVDSEPHWFDSRAKRSKKRGKGSGHPKKKRGSKRHVITDEVPERVRSHVLVPSSIPYTTPASEFIYGLSAVEAALRCTRRTLYVLYIYQSADDEVLSPEKVALRKLALAKEIRVKIAFAGWDKLLDKMSAGRPHNGCVLEASPLPQLPVACLDPVSLPTEPYFNVSLAPQSVEQAAVNGSSNQVARVPRYDEAEQKRFPFVLLLDGILDPGNMGAIIRSAYYLGVDALIITGRNSAPLTPVTIKASAGAAENMTILKAGKEIDFIRRSRQNGWRFYAADSPANIADLAATNNNVVEDGSSGAGILTSAPTVLMLGSEGTGLLPRIKAQADGFISIPGARVRPEIAINDAARVDSLNVSVAAALLMEMLMRVPLRVANLPPISEPTQDVAEKQSDGQSPPPRSFDFN
ncbi:hypothetical protein UA08_00600 [Talaromyces atroroseus]|uniref:rRNA methyltransferase 1, mitochondrial n=1 Tax=Talaromyces atroroseus TaxID=1441469 RepID=A0A225BEN1_TALAT|nr:hypothetical protein UA08_00600 [Talaromyces atroroseus]OKL64497.1 hypothetical protein UA08_00600 [Talaromyces atroroseus]